MPTDPANPMPTDHDPAQPAASLPYADPRMRKVIPYLHATEAAQVAEQSAALSSADRSFGVDSAAVEGFAAAPTAVSAAQRRATPGFRQRPARRDKNSHHLLGGTRHGLPRRLRHPSDPLYGTGH